MNCPACHAPIDPALIMAERQRELASRKGRKGNANRNPWGAKGKPRPAPKAKKETQ